MSNQRTKGLMGVSARPTCLVSGTQSIGVEKLIKGFQSLKIEKLYYIDGIGGAPRRQPARGKKPRSCGTGTPTAMAVELSIAAR